MPLPPRIIGLAELESIPGPGSLTWRPVRSRLGIRAFGCNAYTATEAGQDVVEPHTEDPELAHEELYFVFEGRARFEIDGVSHDVPRGTYVFVPDPGSHRHAVAVEPQTTVLTFGGPPTFAPSGWEWSFRAGPLLRSDPEQARAILGEGLEAWPESPSLHYNLACLEAIQGNREAALAALGHAILLRPAIADWAREDADFQSLAGDAAFAKLLESAGD